jgi:UDP-N-acetylmuramyl pentapeptide phosphotransferase/UDP-N-acetylglucosamine-1-phosphate transferase
VKSAALLMAVTAMLGLGGALWIAAKGHLLGLLDCPQERSSHFRPVPKGGGIGIVAAAIVAGIALSLEWYVWVPSAVAAVFSICADKADISPKIRLSMHFLASGLFIAGFCGWKTRGAPLELIFLLYALYAVFIVGAANVFNFMDGINGIAAISGIVAFGLLGALAFNSDIRISMFNWSVAIACAGFLPVNFPNARVFMGDIGSIMLGMLFACSVLMTSRSWGSFFCAAAFLFPFFADELTTMIVRLKSGENLLKAHRRHLYQLLANEMHYPHWKVAVAYGITQALIGIMAMALAQNIYYELIFLASVFSIFVLFQAYVRRSISQFQTASNILWDRDSAIQSSIIAHQAIDSSEPVPVLARGIPESHKAGSTVAGN